MVVSSAALISAALLGLVGSIAGVAGNVAQNAVNREDNQKFASQENELSREFTAAENEKSRQFEEYMSSTAMQRQVADYKAAGINVGAIGGSGASSGATNTSSPAPMTTASNALSGLNQSGITSNLQKLVESSAMRTLSQNSKEFGQNLTKQMKSNSFQAGVDDQADYKAWLRSHPGGSYEDFINDF